MREESSSSPFPFNTTKEAWDYFTKAARIHFATLIRQIKDMTPETKTKLKFLRHKDYCARLLYILNMFTFEGDHESEFDLDWAMLLAKPLSASTARESLADLIELGLMGSIDLEDLDNGISTDIPPSTKLLPPIAGGEKKRTPPTKKGGDTSYETNFDFDTD